MNVRSNWCRLYTAMATIPLLVIGAILIAGPVFGHGGKTHDSSFTALQSLQKATGLYDKLVATGKLAENWETDLVRVEISNRQKGGQKEHVVSFQRKSGEPNTVYIFLSADGKYAGSNFTGK